MTTPYKSVINYEDMATEELEKIIQDYKWEHRNFKESRQTKSTKNIMQTIKKTIDYLSDLVYERNGVKRQKKVTHCELDKLKIKEIKDLGNGDVMFCTNVVRLV